MERVSNLSPKGNLSTYRELISALLPFVLIRCVKYTNSKRLAETIAVYTLVASYYLARVQETKAGILIVIGCTAETIGEELGNGNTLNGLLLFEREDALCATKALAGLDLEESIAMALYYVEKLDLEKIAEITGKSIDETVGTIGKAQSRFLENLVKLQPRGAISFVGEIRRSMDSVADSFDKIRLDRIIATVMDYLIKQG